MLDPFHADTGVEFPLRKRQPMIEIGKHVIGFLAVDVRADRLVSTLAQARRQQTVASRDVQNLLPFPACLDDLENNPHITSEIWDVGEFGFEHGRASVRIAMNV